MAQLTVFGAGAMGTALAMHSARRGVETAIWATPHDEIAFDAMRSAGRHPNLREHLPAGVQVFASGELDDASAGCEIAVMAAHAAGARSLARMAKAATAGTRVVVSVAKGLEPESRSRPSEVYEEELPGAKIIAVGGPCLAPELAEGQPTVAVWGSVSPDPVGFAADLLDDPAYRILPTDDVIGLEYCAVTKNVAAIGLGVLDGIGKPTGEEFRNAKAALFSIGVRELVTLVVALGGRQETALGPAGLGDVLVTSLGGRNRLYGELVGEGASPKAALAEMNGRGMTVEGVESARHVRDLASDLGLELPYHFAVESILFEGGDPRTLLEELNK
ncbi:MAG: NAD(P)H-dependent glycerol-3-phosphate dehydrogenase [Actinomycetota bacterium]